MTDAGYVVAGYIVTATAVGSYAAALRARARRLDSAVAALRRTTRTGR